MNPKPDPYATKLHSRINVLLLILAVVIFAIVLRTSAHGQTFGVADRINRDSEEDSWWAEQATFFSQHYQFTLQSITFRRTSLTADDNTRIAIAGNSDSGSRFTFSDHLIVGRDGIDSITGQSWTGGGTTDNWSDSGNWGGAQPGYGTISFAGSNRTTNVMDQSYNMNQINWNGSSAWTMNSSNGAVLNLFDNSGTQAKVESLGAGGVTINAPITFAATTGTARGEINAITGNITFGSAGTLTVNGSAVNGIALFGSGHTVTFNNTISAGTKWFGFTGSGSGNTAVVNGTVTSGDWYVMNNGTLNIGASGNMNSAGAVRLGGDFGNTGFQDLTKTGMLQLTATGGGQTFSNTINSVSGNTSGTLVVNALNTSGTDTLSGHIALDSALKITEAAGGTLNITQVKGGDNSTGNDIKGNTETFTPASGGTINHSGTIYNSTGTGSVAMNGAGTLILSGSNTYSGSTSVTAGTLFVNNTTGSGTGAGNVTVNNSGTTLGGSGTISGTVSVASSGANLSPGASGAGSTAILRTGALTLASGSNFRLDLNNTTAGTGYDQASVTGTVSITGSNIVVIAGAGLSIGDKFFVVLNDNSDLVTGTFAQGTTVTSGGDSFLINYADNGDGGGTANDISLTLTAVPEPSTWLAAGLALGAMVWMQLRKHFARETIRSLRAGARRLTLFREKSSATSALTTC